jgi:hypothetical protein
MGKLAGQYVGKRSFMACRSGWLLAASCAGALSLSTAHVSAAEEESNAAETAAARTIALEGIRLAEAGRCEEAIEKLSRAEKLHHAPIVLGRLGECQVLEGKLVDGTESLRKVLREALPANASPALLKARERAQSVLDKAKPRIAALHIVVNGPAEDATVAVMVDGELMNSALLEADRPTDPGDHLIEASAAGFLRGSARVSLGPGDRQHISIDLVPDPNAVAAANAASAPQANTDRAPDAAGAPVAASSSTHLDPAYAADASAPASMDRAPENEPSYTGAYISWAAGGAAVIAGSIFGLMAFNGKSQLDEQCLNNVCPPTSRDELDSARTASTAATVLFALGGVGLGLGTVLFFSADSAEDAPVESSASRVRPTLAGREALPPRAFIGLGHVGVAGEF